MSYLNLNGLQYFFNKYIKPLIQGKQDTIEGGASTITGSNLTTNRALVSNGSGKVAVSAVTATELGYLDGVTSGIQGQLNGKQGTVTGGASTITGSNLTTNRALVSNGSGKVEVSAVTATELGYLDGVTSGIQGQINALNNNLNTHFGNVRKMYTGSKIVTGTGNTSVVLFTLSELNGLIDENLSASDGAAFVSIFIQNGDAGTNGAHFSGVNYQTSGTWLAVAESTIGSGSKARLNYLIVVR